MSVYTFLSKKDMTPINIFGQLPVGRYCFQLDVAQGYAQPEYPAVTIRGLLGWTLQETVCPFFRQKKPECAACFVRNDCPYFYLYEQKTTIPGQVEAPRGYLLYAPPRPESSTLSLELTLFGRCNDFFPVLSEALTACGRKGLGTKRKTFQVVSCSELTPSGPIELPCRQGTFQHEKNIFMLADWLSEENNFTEIQFITPLRLRKKGRYLTAIDWNFFYSSLIRRVEGLHTLYGDGTPLGRENWLAVNRQFDGWQRPVGRLRWQDLNRYSNRQRKKIPLGGLVGKLQLNTMPSTQNLWLQTASLLHVGKGTVMGLGRIELS